LTRTQMGKDSTIKKSRLHSVFTGFLPVYVAVHFVHHMVMALPTPLLPLIRNEFELSYTRSALIQSSFSWTYGTAQIPAGFMADRIGPRILLIIGICGVAAGGILVGLSRTYVMMLVFLVVMGIVGGGYHPAATPMVSAAAGKDRGRALGFHEMGASASFLVTPLIATAIASVGGWRIPFIALAIPTMIFGLLMISFTRQLKKAGSTDARVDYQEVNTSIPKVIVSRLVAFLLLSVLTGGIASSVFAFVTLYAVDNFGASITGAASFLVISNAPGIWVSPLGGYLSDRLGRVPLVITTSLTSAIVIYLLGWAPYYWGTAIVVFIYGMASYARMPVSESYIIGQTTERNRSLIYGIYYFSMTESSALLAPLMGYLMDNYGFTNCFTWASIAIVMITLVLAPLVREGKL
jgi:YNFM family putative membrane transporter